MLSRAKTGESVDLSASDSELHGAVEILHLGLLLLLLSETRKTGYRYGNQSRTKCVLLVSIMVNESLEVNLQRPLLVHQLQQQQTECLL